jgi:hypothetical protein
MNLQDPDSKEFQVTAKLVDAVNRLADHIAKLNEILGSGIAVKTTDQSESRPEQSRERG